ncbi:MAG: hypothetical protein AAF614_36520 [Chloroflexota bacterium]
MNRKNRQLKVKSRLVAGACQLDQALGAITAVNRELDHINYLPVAEAHGYLQLEAGKGLGPLAAEAQADAGCNAKFALV